MSAVVDLGARDRIDPQVWKISWVVLLGPLLTSLDSTVVNVSLSTLGRELHVSLTTLQWVVTGYLLALALMLPLSGWVVDRLGAKRVYLGCFTMFTMASLLCGISPSAGALIAARVLQGIAGGLLAPMAQMMVARAAPRHIARVMGIMVVPVLLGPICGPSLAGFILQHASWRWIFFINLPIGVLAIVLAALILPKDGATEGRRSFDLGGFLLISPGLVLAMHSLESLGANPAAKLLYLVEFAGSVGLLAAFMAHSVKRGRTALIDVSLFKDSSFLAASWTQFLLNAVSFGGQMLLPLYMMSVMNISPAKTGLLLAPAGLGMLCSYPSMGMMTDRFGSRWVSASGAMIALVGTLPFALLNCRTLPTWAICAALFLRGVGMGSIGLPSIAAAYSSISKEAIPAATTAINIFQRLGGPVATTALAIFLHAGTASSFESSGALTGAGNARAYSATFWLLCVLHCLTVIAALRLPVWAKAKETAQDYEPSRRAEAVAK